MREYIICAYFCIFTISVEPLLVCPVYRDDLGGRGRRNCLISNNFSLATAIIPRTCARYRRAHKTPWGFVAGLLARHPHARLAVFRYPQRLCAQHNIGTELRHTLHLPLRSFLCKTTIRGRFGWSFGVHPRTPYAAQLHAPIVRRMHPNAWHITYCVLQISIKCIWRIVLMPAAHLSGTAIGRHTYARLL